MRGSSPTEGWSGARLHPSQADGAGERVGTDVAADAPARSRSSAGLDLAGSDAFDRAAEALATWAVHRGAGLTVVTGGDVEIGRDVVLVAKLAVGYALATCRVVAVVDEPDRMGFAYGTLSVHPERGEESFVVTRTPAGARFDVRAVSSPSHPLARLAPWIARRVQRSAIRRYLEAMNAAVTG